MLPDSIRFFIERNPVPAFGVASHELIEDTVVSYGQFTDLEKAIKEAREHTFKSQKYQQDWTGFVYDHNGNVVFPEQCPTCQGTGGNTNLDYVPANIAMVPPCQDCKGTGKASAS